MKGLIALAGAALFAAGLLLAFPLPCAATDMPVIKADDPADHCDRCRLSREAHRARHQCAVAPEVHRCDRVSWTRRAPDVDEPGSGLSISRLWVRFCRTFQLGKVPR